MDLTKDESKLEIDKDRLGWFRLDLLILLRGGLDDFLSRIKVIDYSVIDDPFRRMIVINIYCYSNLFKKTDINIESKEKYPEYLIHFKNKDNRIVEITAEKVEEDLGCALKI